MVVLAESFVFNLPPQVLVGGAWLGNGLLCPFDGTYSLVLV